MDLLKVHFGFRAIGKLLMMWSFLSLVMGAALPAAWAKGDGLQVLDVDAAKEGGSAKTVQARMIIDAPPALVWNLLTDYPDIKNYLPGYEKSTVIRAKGTTKWLDIAMRVAAFLPTYKYQVQAKEDEANLRLTLNRVSGDFKTLNANYKLVSQANGDRTLLIYNMNIDPGFSLPGSQGLIKASTEKSLKALERHAEQEARKSLIGQR